MPLGWLFMLSSLAFVWVLTAYCFYRVFTAPEAVPEEPKHFHSA
jgi:hypothetical protein